MADDLNRLFAGHWLGVALSVTMDDLASRSLDRDQVGQALWALLHNATEVAMALPSPMVTLRMRGTKAGLAIGVADNGTGVPPDAVARIFRPFHTTKPEGAGVGLSLARQIALAHNGTLTLEPGLETLLRLILSRHAVI